ncbi:MAG TPA: BTAD domain-containing putative transcriptional regulator [Nitriliruptorales bacterium]|nr:BTAD domain-containing putative transcriptional regulator [Nitriliruptorales bacterium]
MEFRLLGPLEVVDGDRPVALPRGRARSLLALLALRPGEVQATDRLIDALWGEHPPPTAATALQGHISTLRKRLEPDRGAGDEPAIIVTHLAGYVLAVGPEQVDAARFRRLVERALAAFAVERADELRQALALWRGPALADFAYEPFAQTPIAALEELRAVALEARIGADLELGRHAEVVAEVGELVAEHPLREDLRGHLMVALYRCGRQTRALEVYRDARRYLVEELGVEPGPRLRALDRAILDHDPSLDAPVTVGSRPDVATGPWLGVDRRNVTVVVVDVSPAASAGGGDPEVARPVVGRAHEAVRAALGAHGGAVQGVVGDTVVAVFGLPVAHEDDAGRALRAAAEIRRDLARLNGEAASGSGLRLSARLGISSGEVVVDPAAGAAASSGPPVTLASRLQQLADEGEVLLDEATRRLVQPVALLEPVAGPAGTPAAWRLVDVVAPPVGLAPNDTPLVGREPELAGLIDARDRAIHEGRARLVTVLGDAGIGKSRLARAFVAQLPDDVRVAVGRCRAYGRATTFRPLREIARDLAGGADSGDVTVPGAAGEDPDAALIAAAVGLSDEPVQRPAELFAAVRRLLERISHDHPLVVVVEDAHWAQPTLLDLVEYLADEVQGPVLLVCLARPELLEQRPRWASGLAAAATVQLGPLPAPESRQLVTARLAGRLLAPETMGQVLAMGQGNPLFLEQLLAALREDQELTIPPTVQALLTARLDRLGPAERDLLRCASVIGVDVPLDALATLVPDGVRPYLDRHLAALSGKELIRPWPQADGRRGFDFGHVLIQQAAYRSLTRGTRAELHERLADWLDVTGGAGGAAGRAEVEELVGHHLEQAVLHRRELGRSDAGTAALAVRAGELLAAAGLRAYDRFDVPAAEDLLSRARRLLPREHPDRPAVLRRLTEAYPVMGRPGDAEEAFAERLELAERDGDEAALRSVRLERLRFRLITGPDPIPLATIQREVEEALAAFRRAGDAVGVSQAHYVLARVHLTAGRMAELEEVAWRGVERARETRDRRERLGAPWWVVFAMLAGPTPVPACIAACEDVLDVGGLTHLGVLAALGHFRAMLGAIDEGRRLVHRARELLRERIRLPRPLTFIAQQQAGIELLAGEARAAVGVLREALDVALRVTERDDASQIAAQLSLLLADLGETVEARRLADLAEEQAPSESVTARALTRAAVARIRLDAGDLAGAEALIRGALDAVPADMLDLRAQLHLRLAEVVAAAGRVQEARSITQRAVDLYTAKGNLVGAERAGALSDRASQRSDANGPAH